VASSSEDSLRVTRRMALMRGSVLQKHQTSAYMQSRAALVPGTDCLGTAGLAHREFWSCGNWVEGEACGFFLWSRQSVPGPPSDRQIQAAHLPKFGEDSLRVTRRMVEGEACGFFLWSDQAQR
jgi:hypothetical protein